MSAEMTCFRTKEAFDKEKLKETEMLLGTMSERRLPFRAGVAR
ncbi:MAG: hypothetical protein ACI8YQ_003788 [Polaribacter sp.]|jgi:hypothetical protein